MANLITTIIASVGTIVFSTLAVTIIIMGQRRD